MKRLYWLAAVVFLAAAFLLFRFPKTAPQEALPSEQHTSVQNEAQPLTETAEAGDSEESYCSPIDFMTLQAENPDIYAWLSIPEAGVEEAVLQHEEDDSYYLTHNSQKEEAVAGALFTEKQYNSRDFSDPVTVIYGHTMSDGSMFGSLQAFYSDPTRFEEQNKITIYLPDKSLHYQVFAATVYDDRHLLDNYDFQRARVYQAFFESIFSIRGLNSNIDKECTLDYDSRILVLSTCLHGDYSQRYLVFAKQIDG